MEKASCAGLGLQEESITDFILSHIQYSHHENFFTRKFTHKEEGNFSGADWLWCIGEPGAWITFAVQAKIASLATGNVHNLHYRNGNQHKLLIQFSKAFRLIPKYSIYSKIENDMQLFSRGLPEVAHLPLETWAFSAISPKHISHLTTRIERNFRSVLQLAIPWTFIFCPRNDNLPIAKSIVNNLECVYWNLEQEFRRQNNQPPLSDYKRITWENPQPTRLISENIPLLILYLLTIKKFPFKIPIANASILSTVSVQSLIGNEIKRIENSRQWKSFPNVFERKIIKLKENSDQFLLYDGRYYY